MNKEVQILLADVISWKNGWVHYIQRHLSRFAHQFEAQKDILVDILMARRGTYQRPFLHISLTILLIAGVTGAPIIANAYPGGVPKKLRDMTPSSAVATSLDMTDYGVDTKRSEKPRDKVESYRVKDGDTLEKIAQTYGISVDTIRWANDIKRDSLSIDQILKIPPVTGIIHKVQEGDTVQSIAKRYKTDSQKIVNYPFNDFADLDTFALNVGQTLIVPDGVQPSAPAIIAPILPSIFAGGSGKLLWPTSGVITQYPIWYHMAYDIANPAAPGVAAADDGVIILTDNMRYGYGNYIEIDHGGGLVTLYGHLSEIYVKIGDKVNRGQVIGRMGSTGRSTGTHLHFETRLKGRAINPVQFFK